MKKYLFMMMAALLSLPIAAKEQPKNNISIQVDTNVQKNNIFIRGYANMQKQIKNLYIIDGVVVSKENWDRIPKEHIKSLNTFKNVEQVFVIETNNAIRNLKVFNPAFKIKPSETYTGSKTIILDSALKAINQEFKYEYSNSNNSVKITHHYDSTVINSPSIGQIVTPQAKHPLWIIKDEKGRFKVFPEKKIHDMNLKLIKTINILKKVAAEPYKKYGDISNGVVVIELKNQ